MTPKEKYKNDIFRKINFDFKKGKKLLDIGCGDGSDAKIFIKRYGLEVFGIDIYKHKDTDNIKGLHFQQASIFDLPFGENFFDYVFLHDILHHIDEKNQSYENHINGLKEVKRVCKSDGQIIILEANRYNPLFYPHMVLLKGHKQFGQRYIIKIIKEVFPQVDFKFFEAHVYPPSLLSLFRIYEFLIEKLFFLKPFRAYIIAIIQNEG